MQVAVFTAPSAAESEAIKAAIKAGEKVAVYKFFDRLMVRKAVERARDFFAAPDAQGDIVGMVLGIKGERVLPTYEPENGRHELSDEGRKHNCLVHTSEAAMDEYAPPAGLEKRASIRHQPLRRAFKYQERQIEDCLLDERLYVEKDGLAALVEQ